MGLFDKVRAVRQQVASMFDEAKTRHEIERCEKELQANPENVFAMQQLSELYQESGDVEKAVAVMCQAAELHRSRREIELALAFFRKAERLAVGDRRLDILRHLVDLNIQARRFDEVYQRMRQTVEILIGKGQSPAALAMVGTLPPLGLKDAQYRKELTEMINVTRDEWTQGARGTWVVEEHAAASPETVLEENQETFPDHTLLLVDDEPGVLQLLSAAFSRFGCRIITAGDGTEALDLAIRHEPTLVISDLLMPRMDGSQLFTALRKHPRLSRVPFVCLTSRGQEIERVSALDRGVEDYWIKPFSIAELTIRVRHLLNRLRRPADFAGRLAQVALPELLQMLESGRKSGELVLARSDGTKAVLRLGEGNILEAELGEARDEIVVYKLVYWLDGEFTFRSLPVEGPGHIALNTQQLLMEAMRRYDEASRLTADFPDLAATFLCTDEIFSIPVDSEFTLNIARIVKLFDGKRTLGTCIAELEGELETLVMVNELIEEKILVPGMEISV